MEKNINQKWFLSSIVILLIIASAIIFFINNTFDFTIQKKISENQKIINPDTYQAVFLTNGQVYFGHLKENDNSVFILNEVYYLQIKENLQGSPAEDQTTENKETEIKNNDESTFTLVQLGEELHQPEPEMALNREHILFWENLQSDSRIIQAIEKYKKDNGE